MDGTPAIVTRPGRVIALGLSHWGWLALGWIALGWLTAGPAHAQTPCILVNPSFEIEGSGGQVFTGWNNFGQVSGGDGAHGSNAMVIRGPNSGAWHVSGAFQDLPATPGQAWRIRVLAAHTSAEPVVGQTRGIVNVEWLDAADQLISFESHNAVVAGDPVDEFRWLDVTTGPAPAGTAEARVLLATLQGPGLEPGAVVYDAVRFEPADQSGDDALQFGDNIGGRSVQFAGRTWTVKGPVFTGPGPNWFDDGTDSVWVDTDGLHLTIRDDNGWASSEVTLEPYLGYGDYRFTVEGRPDLWADNVVLGLFIWETRSCFDDANIWWNPYNEFDVELSRWGIPGNDVAQFVAQPWDAPGNTERFPLITSPAETTHTFAFRWLPDRVECRAWQGGLGDESTGAPLKSWTYTGPHIPRPERPHVRMNLWQFLGDPPSDGQDHEAVIAGFGFAPACPGDVTRDGDTTPDDIGAFVDAFVTGHPDADLNGDGATSPDDIGLFVDSFIAGCEVY